MSTPSSDPNASLSVRLARQIDERCDQFEEQWKRGATPRIEDFLADVSESTRPRLLEELLLLDVHFRARAGELPQTEDYLSRFPELTDEKLNSIIQRGAGSPQRGSTPGDQSTVAHQSGDSARVAGPRLRYFGDYELLEQIARGGMGVVYKARQISLNRLVAVKMILSGQFASEAQVKRFYSEAESAAQLDHPNIVSIYEVGEHEGDHYFSMALVEGTSLAAKLTEGPMEPRRAAELVSQVAQAIEYAHCKGVIHRDLKPSNVLLDANDRPRVTDFGLAKRVSDADGLTMTGDVLGTPSYMPPEQAAGKIDAVGPASDVYALGAVLYALLSGRPPFQAASSHATLTQVVEQEPVRLRQLNNAIPRDLETIAQKCLEKSVARRYASAAALAQDLDNYLAGRPILARPTSSAERAWRWCRRNPVVSSLATLLVLALTATAVISTLAYAQVSQLNGDLLNRTTDLGKALQRVTALVTSERTAKEEAQESEREETKAKIAAQAAEQKAQEQAKLVLERSRELARTLYNADLNRIEQYARDGNIERIDALLRRHIPRSADDDDLRDIEWYYWWQYSHQDLAVIALPSEVEKVAASPDGSVFAAGVNGGRIWLWDRAQLVRRPVTLRIDHPHFSALDFAQDGSLLRAGGWNGNVRGWNLAGAYQAFDDSVKRSGSPSDNYRSPLAISPDGKLTLGPTGESGRGVQLGRSQTISELSTGMYYEFWGNSSSHRVVGSNQKPVDTQRPEGMSMLIPDSSRGIGKSFVTENEPDAPPAEEWGPPTFGVAWSADGKSFAGGTRDGRVFVYDARPLRLRHTLDGHQGIVWNLAFSPGGNYLAAAGADAKITIWDLQSSAKVSTCKGHSGAVRALAWLPTGKRLASAGDDGSIRLWNVPEGTESQTLLGHQGRVASLAVGTDGTLISGGADRTVRLWDATQRNSKIRTSGAFSPIHLAASQDERILCVKNTLAGIHIFDLATGEQRAHLDQTSMMNMAISPDGTTLAVNNFFEIVFWDLNINQRRVKRLVSNNNSGRIGDFQANAAQIRYSPDGKLFALLAERRIGTRNFDPIHTDLMIYQADTLELRDKFEVGVGQPGEMNFSPDSSRLAIVILESNPLKPQGNHRLTIWDLNTSEPLQDYSPLSKETLGKPTWSQQGTMLAVSISSGVPHPIKARILKAETLQPIGEVTGQYNNANWLTFTPDDRELVLSFGNDLWIWSIAEGVARQKIADAGGTVGLLLPRSNRLALSTYRQRVALRNLASINDETLLSVPGGAIKGLALAPEGNRIIAEVVTTNALSPRLMFVGDVSEEEKKKYNDRAKDPFQDLSPHGRTQARPNLFDVLALRRMAPKAALVGYFVNDVPQLSGVLYAVKGNKLALIATALDSNHVVLWRKEGDATHPYKPLIALPMRADRLAFSNDDESLAVVVGQGIEIWDRFGKKLHELPKMEGPIRSIAWSPDNRLLAVATGEHVRVFNVASGELLLTLGGHQGSVLDVMYSTAGQTIVSCGADGFVICHDAHTGELRSRLAGQQGQINDLSLAANGRLLASAGEDGSIRLWPLASRAEVQSVATVQPLQVDSNEPGFALTATDDGSRAKAQSAIDQLRARGLSFSGTDRGVKIYVNGMKEGQAVTPTFEPQELYVIQQIVDGKLVTPPGAALVTDADCQAIGQLKTFSLLSLIGCPITAEGVKELQVLPLKHLSLAGTQLTDFNAANLAKDTLQELHLSRTKIGDPTVQSLSSLTELRALALEGTAITDKSLSSIGGMRQLQMLLLSDTQVTDQGIQELKGLQLLQALSLANTAVTDVGLLSMAKNPALTWFDLRGTKVSLEGIKQFQELAPQVNLIFPDNVGEGRWADRAIAKGWGSYEQLQSRQAVWKQAAAGKPLTRLQANTNVPYIPFSIARLGNAAPTTAGRPSETDIRMIEALPSIQFLSVPGITDELLPRLLAGKSLRQLNVTGTFSDAAISLIAQQKDLESLTLGSSKLSAASASEIKQLASLRILSLSGVDWSLRSILEHCPNLQSLSLSKTPLTNQDLAILKDFPHLTALTLTNKSLTDECLPSLQILRKLKRLDLHGTSISSRAKSRLEDVLPDVDDVD